LCTWCFGARDRAYRPQAVVSHDSALTHHELPEILPDTIHLAVPGTFCKPAPRGVVLHKASLAGSDIEDLSGFRVTTPMRMLEDNGKWLAFQTQIQRNVTCLV
jgi:predicted transcriptional regulator of viral defense system